MISVYALKEKGRVECSTSLDPAWLDPASGVRFWVDLSNPAPEEGEILSKVFKFHELSIEDALSEIHQPKIEAYDNYLYLILHGIYFRKGRHDFETRDVDFFLGENYLVTVSKGESRSLQQLRDLCSRNGYALAEGPAALLHRIVDTMVDNYGPEVEALNDRINDIEKQVFEKPQPNLVRTILSVKRDISSLRRVTLPQRDVIGRIARREFRLIPEQIVYRFRDVHDHLIRLSDEALLFQDRVTSLLEANLSQVSNQLNSVMKILTVITTIFMPLTLLTGLYGMNVSLPDFPGHATADFWWIVFLMVAIASGMLWFFRRRGWL
ncbi:MAG TPA: magnesium/cobalt transporter CorA [Vicinamibacterales bacterium]|jgi:magnesium transporter|nr:magnesium/cobalt transporter CorA [Vicinamibacterales bacterium]